MIEFKTTDYMTIEIYINKCKVGSIIRSTINNEHGCIRLNSVTIKEFIQIADKLKELNNE